VPARGREEADAEVEVAPQAQATAPEGLEAAAVVAGHTLPARGVARDEGVGEVAVGADQLQPVAVDPGVPSALALDLEAYAGPAPGHVDHVRIEAIRQGGEARAG
jgi:hypothetical protein